MFVQIYWQINIYPLISCPLYPFPLSLAVFIREAQFSAKGSDSNIDAGSVRQRWTSMSPFVCKINSFYCGAWRLETSGQNAGELLCLRQRTRMWIFFVPSSHFFLSSWEQTCLFLLWPALISYDLDRNLSRLLLCCIHRSWTKATDSRTYVPVSRAKSVNITAVVKVDFENRTLAVLNCRCGILVLMIRLKVATQHLAFVLSQCYFGNCPCPTCSASPKVTSDLVDDHSTASCGGKPRAWPTVLPFRNREPLILATQAMSQLLRTWHLQLGRYLWTPSNRTFKDT